MRRIEARRKNAKAFRLRHSQSLARRRQRLSHAMVRSTIQRFGKTTNSLTPSERLTISMSRCGRTFAMLSQISALYIRCRRTASSKMEPCRTVSSRRERRHRDPGYRPDEQWRGAAGLLCRQEKESPRHHLSAEAHLGRAESQYWGHKAS